MTNLERGKRVHVHLRHCPLHRLHDVDVGLTRVVWMDAALHANRCGAPLPGFGSPAVNFIKSEVIGLPAEVFRKLAF